MLKILLVPICLTVGCCLSVSGGDKPSILLIYTDDQGYGDASCMNPDSKFLTPHFDRLAREGIRFTDAHSPASVCTPSRYGLLTGRYAKVPPVLYTRKKKNKRAMDDYRITPPYSVYPENSKDLEVAPDFADSLCLKRFTDKAIAWMAEENYLPAGK